MRLFWLEIGAVVSLGVVLGGFGPFGTFVAPLAERLVYWILVLLIAYAFFRPAVRLCDSLTNPAGPARVIGRLFAIASVSAPLTIMVWLASFLRTPTLWPSMRHYLGMYVSVVFVGIVMVGLLTLMERLSSGHGRIAAPSDEPPSGLGEDHLLVETPPRFFARLPFHMRAELLALEVEDHYVRAHTARGDALLLMRLSDAIAELDGYSGAQVHRSWWVASDAVREVQGPSRARRLVLSNGLVVPVARAREEVLDELRRVVELRAA